ncbi:PAS domain-containing sensor histidine kinase [Bacillus testis]|uniref:PAS domain-containing sensor histidine kinase n=1 Tax=Bacillus testis TaxID=1622072 RepID=UPI00067F0281|nr:PAS domain-containing sensor histidine kinase [Bacillus testis]
MNNIKKNLLVYIFIIIIPTILAGLLFQHYLQVQADKNLAKENIHFGRMYQHYIESFIKETIKSLDVLAIVSAEMDEKPGEITNLLTKTKEADKRYGNLYYVDERGIIKAGTNANYHHKEVKRYFINSCSRLKKSYVSSSKRVDPSTNNSYFYICKPILNADHTISGFILAQLSLDYVKGIFEKLTPQIALKITNFDNKEILSLNNNHKEGDYQQKIAFDTVPWVLNLNYAPRKIGLNSNALLKFIVFFLFITHILFLSYQHIQYKREETRRKKEYNDQKLSIIGTLAASTAHEIKNPLTGIKGLVQLLSEKYQNSIDQMYFSVIQKEIHRINEIVNEFLVLGKPSIHPVDQIDLNHILEEMLPMLEREAEAYSTSLQTYLCADPVYVKCSKDQIKQVILNIVKNGFESCMPGGAIEIALSIRKQQAILIVRDNGKGMDEETVEHIFEPFFTTKEFGTGLGLYICRRILNTNNGKIVVESEAGKGTECTLSFPLMPSASQDG